MKAERHPACQAPAVWVVHLEQDSTNKEEGTESEDHNGIKGVTKEFIVCFARAVKEAQQEEKCTITAAAQSILSMIAHW